MLTAIILMNVARGTVNEVAGQLAGLDGVSEVFSVGGRYDLVVMVRVPSNERLATLVTSDMAANSSIEHTETLIAFQAFSRHDLEAMFSIGS